jgi:hypothetical protein
MVVLDEKSLNPEAGDFTVKEDEGGKRIRLSFYLPADFNNAEVTTVEALVSPDEYIMGSGSSVVRERNGEHRVDLTLYVSERVLNDGAADWETLMKELAFEGFIAHFRDASGETVQFGEPLPLKEMKREAESEGNDDNSEGGGCNAGWSVLLSIPFISTIFFRVKKRN